MYQKKTEERKSPKTHGLLQCGKRKNFDLQLCFLFFPPMPDVGHPKIQTDVQIWLAACSDIVTGLTGLTINTAVG